MNILEQYRTAVRDQPLPGLAAIASAAAKDFGAGNLTWDELAEVNDLVQARRDRAKAMPEPKLPRIHRGATPRTSESIERRRGWAGDGRVPREYEKRFTRAQLGVLNCILKECVERGACRLPLDAIAGAVGTCKTVVRAAVRIAIGLGLIESKEHRRSFHRSDPNTVRVVSQSLKDWLARGVAMARKAKGAVQRAKAQAAQARMRCKVDDRRGAETLRRERLQPLRGVAKAESLRGAAERRVCAKGGGSTFANATQESSLREESPFVATQLQEENCPSGSFFGGVARVASDSAAAGILRGLGLAIAAEARDGPILDGVAYRRA